LITKMFKLHKTEIFPAGIQSTERVSVKLRVHKLISSPTGVTYSTERKERPHHEEYEGHEDTCSNKAGLSKLQIVTPRQYLQKVAKTAK